MKRIHLLTIFLFVALTVNSNLQAQSFKKDQQTIHGGIGLGGGIGLPIGLGYEKAISDRIGIGAYAAFATEKESYGTGIGWRYNYILATAKGSYHFAVKGEKLDPYAGLSLGYNIASVKWEGSGAEPISSSAGGFLWGIHLGSRYWFSDKLGAFGELGYGISLLNVGVALKL